MGQGSLSRQDRQELQLMAIRETLRATTAAPPLDEILSIIANITIIVCDASSSWFMLVEGGRLQTALARGQGADTLRGSSCELGEGLCGTAALDRRIVILQPQDIAADDRVLGCFTNQDTPVILLPLHSSGQVLGLLGLVMTPSEFQSLSFLATIAEQTAAAIESARLREETGIWRQRLDAVFAQMQEAMLLFDRTGKLALMNEAATALLQHKQVATGDSAAEVLAKVGIGTSASQEADGRGNFVDRALRGEQVEHLEQPIVIEDGPARHMLISAVPILVKGKPQGVISVWRDISFIKEQEQIRAQFLAMVSHELRTPLTSIQGYSQLLQRHLDRGRPAEQMRPTLESIVDQARRLNILIEDLLDVSRAEAGQLTLEPRPLQLCELLQRVVRDYAALLPDRHLLLDLPPGARAPLVTADAGRIEQVLRNLLENAVKYSGQGTAIGVRLAVEPQRLVVAVSDSGSGIAPEDIPLLFVPFQRLRQTWTSETKGIGLGLFISRAIVEAHHGEMWVRSRLNQGSTFHFSLPLSAPPSEAGPEDIAS